MTSAPLRNRLSILASFRGPSRVLHLTTLAFFLSFVVWFDMAPFLVAIGKELHLTKPQLVTLTLCNLALTVPARVLIGSLLDSLGPRRLFAGLLVLSVIPNTMFALSHSFTMLVVSRLLLGIVGAGFVVGIRMVSEWFPAEDLGTAEGVYGGWGNFGSAAAALALPGLATAIATGAGGWRWGVGIAGVAAAVYGVVYWFSVSDTPPGKEYVRPRRKGALPVSTPGAGVGPRRPAAARGRHPRRRRRARAPRGGALRRRAAADLRRAGGLPRLAGHADPPGQRRGAARRGA